MMFVARLLESVLVGSVIIVVVSIVFLFVVWGINRGLQLFMGLLGYEIGDFFGWMIRKMGIKKKKQVE